MKAMGNKTLFNPDWLRKDLGELIDSLDLGEEAKHFCRSRWLESVVWMESTAQWTRNVYYVLRMITVVGAVVVTALVSLNAVGTTAAIVTWLTFSISLLVAVSAATESFFQFGARWRHYRGLVEGLKAEGWAFSELSTPYDASGATHASAFPTFVLHVNSLLRQETQSYIAEIATPTTTATNSAANPPAANSAANAPED
jgi:Protein of unknown function (DUF4231)